MQPETSEKPTASAPELATFIHFASGGSRFLLPILQVKEICEAPPIRVYPVSAPGHLGVSNVHGNIIPILSMDALATGTSASRSAGSGSGSSSKDARLIIVTSRDGESFGILGTSIKKITAPAGEIVSGASALIEGTLMLSLVPEDIVASWEDAS